MGKSPDIIVTGEALVDSFVGREAVGEWVHDLAPYGCFTTDATLTVRSWNQWLESHSGLTGAAVIGRPLLELFPDIAQRGLDRRYERALAGEVSMLSTALHRYLLPLPTPSRDFEVPHMLQSGCIAPLRTRGETIGTITIIEDVTQRECQAAVLYRQQDYDRLLSTALELLHKTERPFDIAADLFPHLAAPLRLDVFFNYLLADEGRVLRLHSAAGVTAEVRAALTELPVGEALGGTVTTRRAVQVENNVQGVVSESGAAARRLGLQSYASFPLIVGERLLGALVYGSYERPTLAPAEVAFLTKIAHYAAIALDRADRTLALQEAERRLRHHAEQLETTVAERTAALRESVIQLEGFSYTVAHDLRAPIRALTGYSDILLSDYGSALPEAARHMLERLQQASGRLDALTRDLLNFSRIRSKSVQLVPVNVTEVVADIIAASPVLQVHPAKVQADLGVVQAQRTLLQQCLSNLLDNAVKFSKPGAAPAITIRSETRGGRIRIWIEDEGIGIPAFAHTKIFEVFERIPGPSPVEGTGIGLAIVARATEQMKGAYGVESSPGRGSSFWLEFPAANPPPAA